MKKIALLISCIMSVSSMFAQENNPNPFAKHGYDVKVVTMTNGRFPEFHDRQKVVQIGSVYFDTKSKIIAGDVELDTTVMQLEPQTISRWMCPDPLAEKYYHISPYAYCANNPIKYIDPDGLSHYSIDSLGNIAMTQQTDDKFDMLFSGNNSLKVNDQSILSGLATQRDKKDYNGSYAITGDQKDVFNVFVFAADNSIVEWGLSGFSGKDGTSYVISTSHNTNEIYPATSIDEFKVEDMQFKIHSHPNSDNYNFASTSDMTNIKDIAWKYYDSKTNSYSAPIPNHFIYHTRSKSVIEYTPWNNAIPRGTIKTGVGFRRTMGLTK